MTRVTVVGDAFLDVDWTGRVERVCPDAPAPVLDADSERHRAGGAGLAARLAAEAGAEVTFVTALASDAEAEWLRADLAAAGVHVVDLGLQGATPVKLRVRAAGQSLVRVDRNCSPVAPVGSWPEAASEALIDADAVLVSDYGRGVAGVPALAALLHTVRDCVAVVWDPHLRGPRPLPGLDLLTPNLGEAARLAEAVGRPVPAAAGPPRTSGAAGAAGPAGNGATAGGAGADGARRLANGALPALAHAAEVARTLSRQFDTAVAVTAGPAGAALAEPGGEPLVVPVEPAAGDPCGAGDRFAATAVVERARGRPRDEVVATAVRAARHHVATGGAAGVAGAGVAPSDATALAEATRAAGGTVVVAGGCFDVLHIGHVRLLEAARRMGDCLVVCLNGDLSVRRLKGPRRPVNQAADRALVLRSLSCVDEVEVFEGDTPCDALRRLRPHVFVKGADHADSGRLPEHDVMDEWGGRVVFVPLVEGRSTTRILHQVAAAVG